jgi:phospholipid/cholesterol/gamma-HCH transport system ATP-binding protein
VIQVRNVHKTFGKHHVLKGVNLNVSRGKTRVILGLSGSGKSVLMKHIIGLLAPDTGEVWVDGEDITQLSEMQKQRVRKKFGMVFQHAALFDSRSVFDNVAFPLQEHTSLSKDEIKRQVEDKLALVDLAGAGEKFPAELSGGMRKRVGLARAVILEPQCVLYDEPTTGLDPIMTENVDRMIKGAAEKLKVTSLVISHDIGSALNIADEIAVINEGEIVEDCAPEDIRASEHPFVKEFLGTWFGKQ